ncbi:PREDICTED: uncharacterized protein LOC107881377 [Prunus mume]|uniref:Uncharacterized protein LOC107881377 n=1 Tax=Prunus mume TaxID=102107 RepID=A0ABM1LSY0_PRUMU|nr:PREDICTED: uncharacterized protein LOC107881377 [Prunus mume]
MDHLPVGPRVSDAPTSSASSVAQPVSARRRHRPPSTSDTISTDASAGSGSQPAKKNTRGPCRQLKTAKVTRVTNSRINIEYDDRHRAASTAELHSSLAHDIGHVVRTHCPMQWKSWKVIPDEVKMEVREHLSTNYKIEDLDDESLAYVNRLFGERYKQWKSDLHHHFQAFDDPQVALEEGCPKELEGREDSWAWLCAHFLAPEYVIDVFGDVYVRPGNELADSIHTLGRRPGTYCRGVGNARRREPIPRSSSQSNEGTALTGTIAELKGQMSMILESLARSGIPIPQFGSSSTSQPPQPGYQTSTLADNAQTSELHLADDHVDFGTLFD